jgi:protein O-mannosyl-transferase
MTSRSTRGSELPGAVGPLVIALLLAVVSAVPFVPSLDGEFLNWDDDYNFVRNEDFRGLGWPQIRWMFTTTLMGHYIPLTWLSLGLNYMLGGMSPWGYHLGNILLHSANTALFYVVARRLIALSMPETPTAALTLGAAFAALSFSVHPLRVESVAWITERRDVLSTFFFLIAVLAYVCAQQHRDRGRAAWLGLSVAAFGAAVLSKAIVVTLPVALLILDVYPLRRFARCRWLLLLREKLPYLVVAGSGAVVAMIAVQRGTDLTRYEQHGVSARVGMTAYSLLFYPRKLVWPSGLSPLHELPEAVSLADPMFLTATVAVVAGTALLLALRRLVPGMLAAWVYSAVVVAPVAGFVHSGYQLTHDRYSYLSGLGFAVVFGGALSWGQSCAGCRSRRPIQGLVLALGCVSVVGLGATTWQHSKAWRTSEALWRSAITADPGCMICYTNLGQALLLANDLGRAEAALRHAILLRPDRGAPYVALGMVLARLERYQEAELAFRRGAASRIR